MVHFFFAEAQIVLSMIEEMIITRNLARNSQFAETVSRKYTAKHRQGVNFGDWQLLDKTTNI